MQASGRKRERAVVRARVICIRKVYAKRDTTFGQNAYYKGSFNWHFIRIALIFVKLFVNLGSLIR